MAEQLIRVARPAMGSAFEIYAGGESAAFLEEAANQALDLVDALEQRLSHYLPESDVCRVNARAFAEPVRVAPALMRLLLRLRAWSEETEGAFDCTAGRLVRAWGFFRRGEVQGENVLPPDAETLANLVKQIGWRYVELNERASTARFLTPCVELHLGAVGKGYIVQCAADRLRELGVTRALLHCGNSSLVAMGAPPESEGWKVGIAEPQGGEEPVAVVTLRDRALSTSGGLEQFVVANGRRLSHLFDPRTGQPVATTGSVSVLSADAAEGDAFATAFLIQREAWTRSFCETHPGVGALFVNLDKPLSVRLIGEGLDPLLCLVTQA